MQNSEKKELLELFKDELACDYISDLAISYNKRARERFFWMCIDDKGLSAYSLDELSNTVRYLFFTDMQFTSREQIFEFVRNEQKKKANKR